MKFKGKLTFEFQYDVDLKYYGTDNIQEALEIEQSYAISNTQDFVEMIGENSLITVEIEEMKWDAHLF